MANPYRDEKTGRYTTKADWENQQKWNQFSKEAIDIIREQNQLLREQEGIRSEARSLSKEILQDMAAEKALGRDILRSEQDLAQKIIDGQARQLELEYEISQASGDSAKLLNERAQDQEKLLNKYEEELQERVRINEEMGLLDNIMRGLEDIPFLKQFYDGEEAIESMEKSLQNGKSAAEGLKNYMKTVAGDAFKIGRAAFEISNVRSVGQFLADAFFEVSENTTAFRKDMGLSLSDATVMRQRMSMIAADTGIMAINTADTTAAMNLLNEQFGTASGAIKSGVVGEVAQLNKLFGMSAESAGRFASTMMKSGKAAGTITEEARETVRQTANEFGVRLNVNKTLDEAGQITGEMAANMGYNVVQITKAVATAKQFGMTMKDVASASAGLLDFQSSIEAELQAELFTGKQLNLEKARLAALTGDYETLTREINENMVDEHEFTKMNVLQKQKMAAALGMTSDQLADIIYQESNLLALADEANERGDYAAERDLRARNAQEQMNDLMAKASDIAVTYLAPALEVISNMMETLAENSWMVKTMLGAVAVMKFGGLISGVVSLAGALAASGVAGASLMSSLTLGIGAAAIIAGIVAITAMYFKAKKKASADAKADDAIIGSDGGLMVSGPKGSIQLNKDDSIIAGTNLGGGTTDRAKEEMDKKTQEYQRVSLNYLKTIAMTSGMGVGSALTIAYSGFDAVKADTHYGTKFR